MLVFVPVLLDVTSVLSHVTGFIPCQLLLFSLLSVDSAA